MNLIKIRYEILKELIKTLSKNKILLKQYNFEKNKMAILNSFTDTDLNFFFRGGSQV